MQMGTVRRLKCLNAVCMGPRTVVPSRAAVHAALRLPKYFCTPFLDLCGQMGRTGRSLKTDICGGLHGVSFAFPRFTTVPETRMHQVTTTESQRKVAH